MLQISKHILDDWNTRWVTRVSLELVEKGCEGTTLLVHEDQIPEGTAPLSYLLSGIEIYTKQEHISLFDHAVISSALGKWILKSEDVLTRCGCGKSFSLKTGNIRADKIRLLKSKLAKKQHH
jgi:hypothetical protein